jgi:hypothetical protein
MLRLTVNVVQYMSEAHVHVSVHQEDPWDDTTTVLGTVKTVYDVANLMEQYDELTALLMVLHRWAGLSTNRRVDETLDMRTTSGND